MIERTLIFNKQLIIKYIEQLSSFDEINDFLQSNFRSRSNPGGFRLTNPILQAISARYVKLSSKYLNDLKKMNNSKPTKKRIFFKRYQSKDKKPEPLPPVIDFSDLFLKRVNFPQDIDLRNALFNNTSLMNVHFLTDKIDQNKVVRSARISNVTFHDDLGSVTYPKNFR